jgi:hypothetical protein
MKVDMWCMNWPTCGTNHSDDQHETIRDDQHKTILVRPWCQSSMRVQYEHLQSALQNQLTFSPVAFCTPLVSSFKPCSSTPVVASVS